MEFYFGRSARKHRIGRAHALAAISNSGRPEVLSTADGPRLHWVAPDDRGVELHIIGRIAVDDPDLVIIYHVMPTSFDHIEQG